MNKNDWYAESGWYEPLQAKAEKKTTPPRKKRTWLLPLGLLLGFVALVTALSLLLREEPQPSGREETPIQSGGSAFDKAGNRDDDKKNDDKKNDDKKNDDGKNDDGKNDDKKNDEPGDDGEATLPEDEDQMPDDYRAFFEMIYPASDEDRTAVGIPRVQPGGQRMKLESPKGDELTLQELYERCAPSVVGISAYPEGKLSYSWGSGVILTADGLILTNTHVIDGCDSAVVTLWDDREFEAKLVGADGISDIAVLQIQAEGLIPAHFGDSAALKVGEKVAAIGNPLGEEFRMTLTDGVISAISRDVNYKNRSMTLLQTNAAINEGNSGGPLFNIYGQVIGITNMKMVSSGTSIEGIGFAIPSGTVESIVNAILSEGAVSGRPSIGIMVGAIPEIAREKYGLPEGLCIAGVSKGSDAEAKGLRPYEDILIAVNGQPVTESKQVVEIKDKFGVGDALTFTIWRNGEVFDVDVKLVDTNAVYG